MELGLSRSKNPVWSPIFGSIKTLRPVSLQIPASGEIAPTVHARGINRGGTHLWAKLRSIGQTESRSANEQQWISKSVAETVIRSCRR